MIKPERGWAEPKNTSFWIKSKLALGDTFASRPPNCYLQVPILFMLTCSFLDHIDIHKNCDINNECIAFFQIQYYNVGLICFHHGLYFLGHVIRDQELVGDQPCWFWLVLLPVGVNRYVVVLHDAPVDVLTHLAMSLCILGACQELTSTDNHRWQPQFGGAGGHDGATGVTYQGLPGEFPPVV
eukprot:11483052-Ditylum_brightwellii.AAC.1